MKQHKPDDFESKQINYMLKCLIKWQLESVENIKEQYFGIQASQFVTLYIHDLGVFIKSHNLDITEEEWQDFYIKASDEARKDFLKEHKDKQC